MKHSSKISPDKVENKTLVIKIVHFQKDIKYTNKLQLLFFTHTLVFHIITVVFLLLKKSTALASVKHDFSCSPSKN